MVGAAMVVMVASSRSMMSATKTMPRTSHAAAGSLDAPSAGLEDTCTVIGTSCGGLGSTSPLGSRGGSCSGAGRLKRLPAGLGRFGVPGLFCRGSGLPVEVAVGEGAACGQGDDGDGQSEDVAVVEGAGCGVQQGVGLAGGEVACGGAGFVDAAGGPGGGGCGEVDRVGVAGGEDGSQDGDAGEAA